MTGVIFSNSDDHQIVKHSGERHVIIDNFRDLPLHYDEVGHWLQPDETKQTVDVLLDFK